MRTALIFLCVLIMSFSAFPEWTRTSGPKGISMSCLVNIDGTIYAGTATEGLYASTDDGLSWTPMNSGIETLEVTSIVSKLGYLFAGTFGSGVFRSSDGGQTWTPPLTGGDLSVVAMVVKDSLIFAGTVSDGVYRSSDKGETWIQKLSGFVGVLAMSVSGNTIYASTYGYTYASDDNGESWYNVTDLEGAAPWSFYCKDSLILAGGVNKIYKSTDYGNSYTSIHLNFPFSIVNIYDIAAVGSTLFIATSYDGVYKSTDDGLTWSPANEGMGPKDTRALAVSGLSTLIAGTHYVGVYRSTDLGSNWDKSMAGFPAGSSIESMLSTKSLVFAGTRDGVYRTADNGESWTKLTGTNDTINYSSVRGLCEHRGVIYAGTRLQFSATIYKSEDNGDTWIRSGSGLPNDLVFINGLTTSGNNILAGTDDGVYYSSDGGESWHPSNLTNQSIPSIAAGGGYVYAIVQSAGIYRSADDGVSWSPALPSTVDYIEVAAFENYAYAGSFFSGARYSSDNGGSWFVSAGFPTETSVFDIEPVGDGMVLAGTDLSPSWIYASFNNGASYSPYSQGLGPNAVAEAFTVSDSFLFAGTDYNGVWRILRPGVVGVQTQTNVPRTFHLAQNFPNPFNPTTTIKYSIPEAGEISLIIFNILGEEVATLVNGAKEAGNHQVTFDAADLPSGVYLYRLKSKNVVQTKKMMLVR